MKIVKKLRNAFFFSQNLRNFASILDRSGEAFSATKSTGQGPKILKKPRAFGQNRVSRPVQIFIKILYFLPFRPKRPRKSPKIIKNLQVF